MKIEKKEAVKIGTRLNDLGQGEPFYSDGYFIKTDDFHHGSEGDRITCVELLTGLLHYFPEDILVLPIVAKVVIE